MTNTDQTMKWWQLGHRPDYRFSLANERTFLAWIRTALALIAGAIGIDQFATHLGSPTLRTGLALALFVVGGGLGGLAYHRWVRTETAMRVDGDVPRTAMLPMLTVFVAILAAGLAAAVLAL